MQWSQVTSVIMGAYVPRRDTYQFSRGQAWISLLVNQEENALENMNYDQQA